MSLIQNDVMPLVDSGALNAKLTQGANNHLCMLVSGEVVARTSDAPVEIALIMEDSPTSRTAAHKVNGADAWRFGVFAFLRAGQGVENAQVDLGPWVLIAPYDNTRPIHVEEEDRAISRTLPQNVVFDGEVEVRVVAAGNVALELVGRVCKLCREGGVAPAG